MTEEQRLHNKLKELSERTDEVQCEIEKTSEIIKLGFSSSLSALDKQKFIKLSELFTDSDHLMRLVWDNDFKIIYANKTFLRIMKYKLNEVRGRKLFNDDGTSDFMTKDTVEQSRKVVQKNVSNGVRMLEGADNKWIDSEGNEVPLKWLIGFNDNETGLGSSQCLLLTV